MGRSARGRIEVVAATPLLTKLDGSEHKQVMVVGTAAPMSAATGAEMARTLVTTWPAGHRRASDSRAAPDAEMNTGSGLDFSRLDEFEIAYLDAVDEDLKWQRFWR